MAATKELFEPEVHFLGELRGAELTDAPDNNAFCCFEVQAGTHWECVGGALSGQTQVDYPSTGEMAVWSHPIDIHYFTSSIQQWPRVILEVFALDSVGTRQLVGYGFSFLPSSAGHHEIQCALWRPIGSSREEVYAHFLGGYPELISKDAIFTSAKDSRCRLVTQSAGKVFLSMDVVLRHMDKYNIQTG